MCCWRFVVLTVFRYLRSLLRIKIDFEVWNWALNNISESSPDVIRIKKKFMVENIPRGATYLRLPLDCVWPWRAWGPVWWRSPTTALAPARSRSPRRWRCYPPVPDRLGPPPRSTPCCWHATQTRVGCVSHRCSEANSSAPPGWCRSEVCPGGGKRKQ